MMVYTIQTLLGMYQFDNSILSDYVLPDGMDRDILNGTILDYCGENAVRYGDPETLHAMINLMFRKNQKVYQELWDSLNFDYDPLLNYDLTIEETRKHSGEDGTEREVNNHDKSNGTTETKVSAYNSNGYSPSEQASGETKNDSNGKETTKFTTDRSEGVSRREYGDNSARSTQYMIKEQREVVDFNLYDRIRRDFEKEITISVYTKKLPLWQL